MTDVTPLGGWWTRQTLPRWLRVGQGRVLDPVGRAPEEGGCTTAKQKVQEEVQGRGIDRHQPINPGVSWHGHEHRQVSPDDLFNFFYLSFLHFTNHDNGRSYRGLLTPLNLQFYALLFHRPVRLLCVHCVSNVETRIRRARGISYFDFIFVYLISVISVWLGFYVSTLGGPACAVHSFWRLVEVKLSNSRLSISNVDIVWEILCRKSSRGDIEVWMDMSSHAIPWYP